MDTASARSHPALDLPRLLAPPVSIVICNFNYSRYLQEAVTSALVQRPACQVIVVDDGSTDGSRELLARMDARVQVLLQPNGGQLAAYNAGFERCTGDVVIFLDADDALQPHAARALAGLFDAGVVKVHCRMDLVDEVGNELGTIVPATLARGDVATALVQHGVLYPSAPGSGNAYRRSVLQQLFPLPVDASDRVAADFFTIYGSVAFGRVAACDAPLVRYRIHRGNHQAQDADSLIFGNAAQGNDEAAKVATRYTRLVAWLAERSGGAIHYAAPFLDFSVQKTPYAAGVLARPYWQAVHSSRSPLRRLLRSLWLQPSFSWKKKLGLSVWAVLVLLAPRPVAAPLARYVCNPVSRSR